MPAEDDQEDIPVKIVQLSPAWDPRECAVELGSAERWRGAAKQFNRAPHDIPRLIHQIWVQPEDPPCLWIDTWRVDYLRANPDWSYRLWTDRSFADLEMLDRPLYYSLSASNMKAELGKLEVLWALGGVCIDPRIVSLCVSLEPIITSAATTSFLIAYQPDVGPSGRCMLAPAVIAAAPRHPLVRLLIRYAAHVWATPAQANGQAAAGSAAGDAGERDGCGAESLAAAAYTRCIADTFMPITTPPHQLFFPVPPQPPAAPRRVTLRDAPSSVCVDWGRVCSSSALQAWLAEHNKCRRPLLCAFHSTKPQDYPLGRLVPMPPPPTAALLAAAAAAPSPIPAVVHVLVLQSPDTLRATRYINTWAVDFVAAHPGFSCRCWTWADLAKKQYLCANRYLGSGERGMDVVSARLLALEILYAHGGYIASQGVVWSGKKDVLRTSNTGWFDDGTVYGCSAGHPGTLARIHDLYDAPDRTVPEAVIGEQLGVAYPMAVGYSDYVTNSTSYPQWTRCLGADALFDVCGSDECASPVLSWAYDSKVRALRMSVPQALHTLTSAAQRVCMVLHPDLFSYPSLRDHIPALIAQADQEHPDWHVLAIGLLWDAPTDAFRLYPLSPPSTPASSPPTTTPPPPPPLVVAAVVSAAAAGRLPQDAQDAESLTAALVDTSTRNELRVVCGVQQLALPRASADLYACAGALKKAFQIASHEPPLHSTRNDLTPHLWRGFIDTRLAFEVVLSDGGRDLVYKAWNDDGGLNSEAKLRLLRRGAVAGTAVYVKVYYHRNLVFHSTNFNF